jgi:hypothetical protein
LWEIKLTVAKHWDIEKVPPFFTTPLDTPPFNLKPKSRRIATLKRLQITSMKAFTNTKDPFPMEMTRMKWYDDQNMTITKIQGDADGEMYYVYWPGMDMENANMQELQERGALDLWHNNVLVPVSEIDRVKKETMAGMESNAPEMPFFLRDMEKDLYALRMGSNLYYKMPDEILESLYAKVKPEAKKSASVTRVVDNKLLSVMPPSLYHKWKIPWTNGQKTQINAEEKKITTPQQIKVPEQSSTSVQVKHTMPEHAKRSEKKSKRDGRKRKREVVSESEDSSSSEEDSICGSSDSSSSGDECSVSDSSSSSSESEEEPDHSKKFSSESMRTHKTVASAVGKDLDKNAKIIPGSKPVKLSLLDPLRVDVQHVEPKVPTTKPAGKRTIRQGDKRLMVMKQVHKDCVSMSQKTADGTFKGSLYEDLKSGKITQEKFWDMMSFILRFMNHYVIQGKTKKIFQDPIPNQNISTELESDNFKYAAETFFSVAAEPMGFPNAKNPGDLSAEGQLAFLQPKPKNSKKVKVDVASIAPDFPAPEEKEKKKKKKEKEEKHGKKKDKKRSDKHSKKESHKRRKKE